MSNIAVSNVRNFVVLGHSGSGKTTLVDAILFKIGVNDRLGSVDDGSSLADYSDEEKDRKITIYAKPFTGSNKVSGKDFKIIVTDTPGYADFLGQVVAAAQVADAGLVVVDATSGLEVGSNIGYECCEKAGIGRGAVVTGLDKDNANFEQVLKSLESAWGPKCIPITIPTADGSGVISVLGAKDVSDDLKGKVAELKGKLVEMAAETDDSLIEKYLAGEDLSADEIANGLRASVREGSLVPIFACAPKKDVGIAELLEGIAQLFPAPDERTFKDAKGNEIDVGKDAPLAATVWRMVNDPFVGQLAFVRICGGTLKADSDVLNSSKDQKERIGNILVVSGKKQETVSDAGPGDLIALAKLKHTGLSETLTATGQKIVMPAINFPMAVTCYAVSAKSKGDEDKIGTALSRIADEDPTIKFERNSATKELLLYGLGDVQIDVAVGRMKSRSKVDVELHTPKIPYKETVTSTGEGHYKHKKQSGGRGQYGEVYLRVEPKQPDEGEWFANAIVGGVIPGNFIPAVQKGLVEGMDKGAVAGFPVENVKVTVYDGSYHDVDSSEIAFKIAGARALREAMSNAKPVLLEPIMKAKITIPDRFMGDINGDLNHKRGRILGMETGKGLQTIIAEVPQSELFRYSAELRSMTAGQGSFEVEFSRYEIVPSQVAQKVIAKADKDEKEE